MFVTCRKRGVGLTIAHERGEQGWRSLVKKGSGDGEKVDQQWEYRSGYSESDEGGGVLLFCKKKP